MSDPQVGLRPESAKQSLVALSATLLESDAYGSIVETRGVIVSLRTATYDAHALRKIRGVYRQLAARRVRLAAMAVYRLEKIDLRSFGDDEVRAGLGALAKESEGLFSANAVIMDTPGIVAATLRAAASGIVLAARPKTPTRFFDGVSAAVTWLAPQVSWPKDLRSRRRRTSSACMCVAMEDVRGRWSDRPTA